jgi:hypothetical protein
MKKALVILAVVLASLSTAALVAIAAKPTPRASPPQTVATSDSSSEDAATEAVEELNDHLAQQEFERALEAWSDAKVAHDNCVATKRFDARWAPRTPTTPTSPSARRIPVLRPPAEKSVF